jgi:CyaY protein
MTDQQFLDLAERLLAGVEAHCDRINDETDADIDNQRVGGMVTITFRNRSQIVINLQKPLHEVWLAARAGGFHYRWVDGQWQDTKGQGEFWQSLSRHASEQSGQMLDFTPPG